MADSKIPAASLHDQIDRAANATDEALHRTVERGQAVAHGAIDRGTDLASRAQAQYGRAHKKLGNCAHEQPVATVAVAAGIGAVVGLLVSHLFRRRPRTDD